MTHQQSYYEYDGHTFALGCQVPDVRPLTFPAYADSQPMFTQRQLEDIYGDPKRTKARILFDAATFIKSQGGRGSCNGYAGAKALEKSRFKLGHKHVALSGEGLYAQINGGQDNGSMLDKGMQVLCDHGCPPEDLVPHEEYLWNRISQAAKDACPRFKAYECYRADTDDELVSGTAAGFLGVIAVHVANGFTTLDSDGRVTATDGPGNHAVGIDDFRPYKGKWELDMVNSWGRRYGQDGRGWVSWERHLRTTSRYHAFYLIRAATDDPQGHNPPPLKGAR
jgi:hypothetical protein